MGRISALTEVSELASNDYLIVLDSSANIAKKVSVANAFGIPDFGWTASGESWTFSSWTSGTRTGVITVPTDATNKYQAGMRIKISQSTGGTKYGIVHKVEATQLTVFFPEGTTLENEAITSPFYTSLKAPLGFNLNPDLWSLKTEDTTNRSTTSTSYASLSVTRILPAGVWSVYLKASTYFEAPASSSVFAASITLSTNASTETNPESTLYCVHEAATNANDTAVGASLTSRSIFNLSSQTTLTLMGRTTNASTPAFARGSTGPATIIRATSAYL